MGKPPIIAAFCGTGKTYLCQKYGKKFIEFECWRYQNKQGFPHNIVNHIISVNSCISGILISTNPVVLNKLPTENNVVLVYPEISLKDEYIKRFVKRGSSKDFILTLSKYWKPWILEARRNSQTRHIVLKSGQYLESVLFKPDNQALHQNCR